MIDNELLEEIKKSIDDADAILITAGAGMGVDSGLPDFRGTSGFWKSYPVVEKLGLSFEDMANPQWFEKDPALAWAFYGHRFNLYRDTTPHCGFKLLKDLVESKNDNYFILTSNVDGQFQKAGFDEDKIAEVHGSILHWQCSNVECESEIFEAEDKDIDVDIDQFKALEIPHCKECQSVLRPNILMFGDNTFLEDRVEDQEDSFHVWLAKLQFTNQKLVVIELGAGTTIPTIRHKSEHVVETLDNAKLIRINPRESQVDKSYGFSVPLGSLEALETILKPC